MSSKQEPDDYLQREQKVKHPDCDELLNHLHQITTRKQQWPELCVFTLDHRKQNWQVWCEKPTLAKNVSPD